MANLYTIFANGTFESGTISFSLFRFGSPNVTVGPFSISTDHAHGGTKSAKITVTSGFVGGPGTSPASIRSARTQYFRAQPGYGSFNVLPLTAGKKYKLKCWVYVPTVNKIGTDNVLMTFGNLNLGSSSFRYEDLIDGRVRIYNGVNPPATIGPSFIEAITCKVGDCLDQWKQLEFTFIESTPGTANMVLELFLYKFNESSIPGDPSTLDLTEGGTVTNQIFTGGVMYMDDIEIEEQVECDLALSSPAYSKTDETGVDADNGTITVNATTSNGPLEYSLDGVNFQLSNTFINLAPGVYNVTIRDAVPCSTQILGITILEFDAPEPPEPPTGGTLVINAKPITQPNFIGWRAATGPIGFTSISCEGCGWDLANPYRFTPNNGLKDKHQHYPVAALNESFTFYINFKTPLSYPNKTSLRLALISHKTGLAINTNLAPLLIDEITSTTYNIYCEGVTLTAIEEGIYSLAIYDTITNGVLMTSVPIQVMSADWCKLYTILFEYRNSNNIYGTRYAALPNFLNKQRLKVYRLEFQGEGDLQQYRAVSSGVLRNVDVELDLGMTFEMYWFDDEAHKAAIAWQICNFILLNGEFFLPKVLYKIEWNPSRTLNKGKIEMFEQAFSYANRYDPLNQITIIGSEDPLLLGDGGSFIKL